MDLREYQSARAEFYATRQQFRDGEISFNEFRRVESWFDSLRGNRESNQSMKPKKQINFRASDLTARQLEELMTRWGTSQTETITILVDRAYREEIGRPTPAPEDV